MWFGTPNGVSAYAHGRVAELCRRRMACRSNDVACLTRRCGRRGVDRDGERAGVRERRASRRADECAGASSREPIAGLAADERGSIWIATSNHVLRAARDQLAARRAHRCRTCAMYGLPDGLHSVEGVRRHRSVVADARGRIWFSLGRGLSMLDPSRPLRAAPRRRSHMSRPSRPTASPIDLRGALRIPAGRQRLTFTYAGLSLAVPERVRFRYRLDGFDSDWSEPVTTRRTVYTNLGPGPYRFRVMASNSDGEWSSAEAAVSFAIAPAYLADDLVPDRLRRRGRVRIRRPLPPPHAPGRPPAQRPVRGTARRADAHRAGSARHAPPGLGQRVDAAARGRRACAGRVTGAVVARSRARADGTGHR